jgi:SAM-dependent methyltransferase
VGWDASGVEIAPDCALEAARISGTSVACGDFVEVPLSGSYDVIVMLDVIDHFRDPRASVARAFELLSPGGLLVIETGDLGAPWARLLGERWYFFDPAVVDEERKFRAGRPPVGRLLVAIQKA